MMQMSFKTNKWDDDNNNNNNNNNNSFILRKFERQTC